MQLVPLVAQFLYLDFDIFRPGCVSSSPKQLGERCSQRSQNDQNGSSSGRHGVLRPPSPLPATSTITRSHRRHRALRAERGRERELSWRRCSLKLDGEAMEQLHRVRDSPNRRPRRWQNRPIRGRHLKIFARCAGSRDGGEKVVLGGRAKKGRLLRAGAIYCDARARSAPLRLWSSVTVSAAVAPSGEVEAAAACRAAGFLFS